MADFSNSIIDTVPVQAMDVAPRADLSEASTIEGLGNLAASVFQAYGQGAKLKAQNTADTVVGQFTSQQMNVITSHGVSDPAKAKILLEANVAKFVSAYPAISDDIVKQNARLMSDKSLGAKVFEKSALQKAEEENLQVAVKRGMVTSDMSPQQQRLGLQNSMRYTQAQEDLERASKLQTYAQGGVNLTSSQVGLQELRKQVQARAALTTIADVESQRTSLMFQQILSNPTLTAPQKKEQMLQHLNSVRSTAASVGAYAGSDFVTLRTKAMEDLYQVAEQVADGKLDIDSFNSQSEKNIAMQTAILTGDQNTAGLAALGKLFPSNTAVRDLQTIIQTPPVAALINRAAAGRKVNSLDGDPADTTSYNKSIQSMLKNYATGGYDADGEKLLDNQVSQYIKGIDAYQMAIDDPKRYSQVVDLISDPYFGQYVEKKGGLMKPDLVKAQSVIQREWMDEVIPQLREAVSSNVTSIDTTKAGSGLSGVAFKETGVQGQIELVFVGNGVQFVGKGVKGSGNDLQIKVRDLNKKLAPRINKVLHAQAHLQATTNYSQVWGEMKDVFTMGMIDSPSGSSEGAE